MVVRTTFAMLMAVTCVVTPAWAARLDGHSIAVVRVGRAGAALDDKANVVSVLEFSRTGTAQLPKQTITLPHSLNINNTGGLTLPGSSGIEGHLNLSTDRQFLVLGGYDMVVDQSAALNSSSTTFNRSLASISVATGTATVGPRLTDAFSSGSLRSVASNGSEFWTAGSTSSTSGVRYVTGSSATSSTIVNLNSVSTRIASRFASIVNGRLFVSTQTGIQTYGSSLPTSSANITPANLAMSGSAPVEAHAFFFVDRSVSVGATGMNGLDTLYIAEGSGGRAIRKYELNGTTWTARGLAYTSGGPDLFGLIGQTTLDAKVTLFASATVGNNNGLYSFVDSSTFGSAINLGASQTLLAQAGEGYTFRGLAFVPDPAGALGAGTLVGALLLRRRRVGG